MVRLVKILRDVAVAIDDTNGEHGSLDEDIRILALACT